MKPKMVPIDDLDIIGKDRPKKRQEIDVIVRSVEIASELRPGCVPIFVELGTFFGITAHNVIVALNHLRHTSNFYSVDLSPLTKNTSKPPFYPRDEWYKRCAHLVADCFPRFIEGDTAEVAEQFADNSICWLFIDACHCEDCVMRDIAAYAPKVCKGGIVLFHDTNKANASYNEKSQWVNHDKKRSFGVLSAIKKSPFMKQFELVADIHTHHGIQVYRKVAD